MSKPRVTRLEHAGLHKVEFRYPDRAELIFYGSTKKGVHHEFRIPVEIMNVPWIVRNLWKAFSCWKTQQEETITNITDGMEGASALGTRDAGEKKP